MRKDEAFARSLLDSSGTMNPPSVNNMPSQYNAFSRMGLPSTSFAPTQVKPEPVPASFSNPGVRYEAEPSFPGQWQDYSDGGDSDFEIIPPSAFQSNGRHNGLSPQKIKTQPSNPDAENIALQRAMYGNQAPPSWATAQPSSSMAASFQ